MSDKRRPVRQCRIPGRRADRQLPDRLPEFVRCPAHGPFEDRALRLLQGDLHRPQGKRRSGTRREGATVARELEADLERRAQRDLHGRAQLFEESPEADVRAQGQEIVQGASHGDVDGAANEIARVGEAEIDVTLDAGAGAQAGALLDGHGEAGTHRSRRNEAAGRRDVDVGHRRDGRLGQYAAADTCLFEQHADQPRRRAAEPRITVDDFEEVADRQADAELHARRGLGLCLQTQCGTGLGEKIYRSLKLRPHAGRRRRECLRVDGEEFLDRGVELDERLGADADVEAAADRDAHLDVE